MGEKHVPAEPKKIHGDKLAEAFREHADDVTDLPRHPAAETTTKGGWVSGGNRTERENA